MNDISETTGTPSRLWTIIGKALRELCKEGLEFLQFCFHCLVLLCVWVMIFGTTPPSKDDHFTILKKAVGENIQNDLGTGFKGKLAAWMTGAQINVADWANEFTYHDYFLFSVVKNSKGGIVTIGVGSKVYTGYDSPDK